MNKYRKLPFGKYKGEYVYKIILTHIGYIMWLLKNTTYKLTNEEQEVFDALAIATLKSNCKCTFPKEELKTVISNNSIDTPFIIKNGNIYSNDDNHNIIKRIEPFMINNSTARSSLSDLCRQMDMDINRVTEEHQYYDTGELDAIEDLIYDIMCH